MSNGFNFKSFTRRAAICSAALLLAAMVFSGCEDNQDFNHTPPAGQGALIVDNRGFMNVSVFVDGVLIGEVRDGHWSSFDLAPGVRRVVLDETNGDRSFRDDVDLLDSRQTILTVSTSGSDARNLAVSVSFD